MVIVNTVVLIKTRFGLGEPEVALTLAAFGGGSMAAALILPRLLNRMSDRTPMIVGALILVVGMVLGPLAGTLNALIALWFFVGFGYSLTLTPTGRLLSRSAQPEDRPAIFAAQFSLSHACWLVTYPLAGQLGAAFGLETTFLLLGILAALALITALRLWPARLQDDLPHRHPDLPADHPHLTLDGSGEHHHPIIIDDLHQHWPRTNSQTQHT